MAIWGCVLVQQAGLQCWTMHSTGPDLTFFSISTGAVSRPDFHTGWTYCLRSYSFLFRLKRKHLIFSLSSPSPEKNQQAVVMNLVLTDLSSLWWPDFRAIIWLNALLWMAGTGVWLRPYHWSVAGTGGGDRWNRACDWSVERGEVRYPDFYQHFSSSILVPEMGDSGCSLAPGFAPWGAEAGRLVRSLELRKGTECKLH